MLTRGEAHEDQRQDHADGPGDKEDASIVGIKYRACSGQLLSQWSIITTASPSGAAHTDLRSSAIEEEGIAAKDPPDLGLWQAFEVVLNNPGLEDGVRVEQPHRGYHGAPRAQDV